ncbi:hypothetical protein [Nocardia cyriacigeorgica]|nr:hypothetical protein [Nocardia cyriacigeorgica]
MAGGPKSGVRGTESYLTIIEQLNSQQLDGVDQLAGRWRRIAVAMGDL